LCEDSSQLSLEDLFGTIKTFRGLFIRAMKVGAFRMILSFTDSLSKKGFICFQTWCALSMYDYIKSAVYPGFILTGLFAVLVGAGEKYLIILCVTTITTTPLT
jgi:hypothetical protein